MKAVYSFLDTFAVGNDSSSTKDEVEMTFITSMIALSSQMSSLALYCRVGHSINLEPDSWRTFGLLPSPIASNSNLTPPSFHHGKNGSTVTTIDEPPTFTPLDAIDQILSRMNQEPSDEIDREIEDRSSSPSDPSTDAAFFLGEEPQIQPDESDDDDYDPDDDLTDDEYAAKMLARIPNNQMVITD